MMDELIKNISLKQNCVIVDLDGTICDCSHRLHWVKEKPKNYKKFYEEIPNDTIIYGVADIINSLYNGDYAIVILTARSGEAMFLTKQWLKDNRFGYDEIYHRADGDYRPDNEVKLDLYNQIIVDGKYKPVAVFEDRPRNIRMYRKLGLTTFMVGSGEEF